MWHIRRAMRLQGTTSFRGIGRSKCARKRNKIFFLCLLASLLLLGSFSSIYSSIMSSRLRREQAMNIGGGPSSNHSYSDYNVDAGDYWDEDDSFHYNFDDDFSVAYSEAPATVRDETKGDGTGDFETKAVFCFRVFVLLFFVIVMIVAGILTWGFVERGERTSFEDEFEHFAKSLPNATAAALASQSATWTSLAASVTTIASSSGQSWPNVTIPDFASLISVSTSTVLLAPLVPTSTRGQWNAYVVQQEQQDDDSIVVVYDYIYRLAGTGAVVPESNPPLYTVANYQPIWQYATAPASTANVNLSTAINFNLLSDETYNQALEYVMVVADDGASSGGILSAALPDKSPLKTVLAPALDKDDEPTSLWIQPIGLENGPVVATVVSVTSWRTLLLESCPLANPSLSGPLQMVISNSCKDNNVATYQVDGSGQVTFVQWGDGHETSMNSYQETFALSGLDDGTSPCAPWTISTYPTQELRDAASSTSPGVVTAVVVLIVFGLAVVVCVYDCAVHKRQKRVLAVAARSEQILSILYPKQIRDRLFGTTSGVTTTATDKKSDKKKKKAHPVHGLGAKSLLRNYLNEDSTRGGGAGDDPSQHGGAGDPSAAGGGAGDLGSKPIADLFPNTTVLFADIAGFTAWSSVREPSQVFTLLETVYRAFDTVAKKRRVFKVETVGDCYVAVTGLPDPRKDHAVLMARFARECLYKFNELVRRLETNLGPDTGDLAVRVGLHSGPVTAGVLRGDKSRFQLFGDTVNTAARIETTGKRNRIHVSQETANLLLAAGKGDWLRKREEVVEAKGKGTLQTYWLLLREDDAMSNTDHTSVGSNPPQFTNLEDSERRVSSNSIGGDQIQLLSTDNIEIDETDLPEKTRRLVNWNCDVLARLLRQIIAKRNAIKGMQSAGQLSRELNKKEWELRSKFMVLNEVAEVIALPKFDPEVYMRQEDPSDIELSDKVIHQLRSYVTAIALMYRDNPFHNFEHASHVMMSVSKLLSRIVAVDDEVMNPEGSNLHDHTYGITSDPLTQFSVILSALIHDVDHLGVSNMQLVKEGNKLASIFKKKSVAEQNSIVLAWEKLMSPDYAELRSCIYSDAEELLRFRALVVNTVLATDIFDKDIKALRESRWEKAFSSRPDDDNDSKKEDPQTSVNRKATIVIEHLIQASDVAHTMQHWHIYCKWNERLFAEMTKAYKEGRMEKNPADGWYKGELWFYDNWIIPLAKKLRECGVFGVSSDEYLNYALENRSEWEAKGEKVVARLVETYQPAEPTVPADNMVEKLVIPEELTRPGQDTAGST